MHALLLSMLLATTAETLPAKSVKPVRAAAASHVVDKPKARVLQPQRRAPAPIVRAPERKSYPAVELYEVNLNETLRFKPFDDRGRPRKQALAELTRFMRCHHTGKQHRVDARLATALYSVGRHFPGKRIEVFSGYRPKAYCERAHSRHLTASAVDFRVVGVQNEALIAWLRGTFHPSGVGYYPNGVHVHLDLDRDHDTYWIDNGDAPTIDEPADGSDAIGNILRKVAGQDASNVEASRDEARDEMPVPLPAAPAPAANDLGNMAAEPPMDDPRFVD